MISRAKHTSRYGTTHVGPYRGPFRDDTWVPASGERPVVESRFATGPYDVSEPHATYPSGYDPRCASCWLGHSHTREYHERALARHRESKCTDRECYRCIGERRCGT